MKNIKKIAVLLITASVVGIIASFFINIKKEAGPASTPVSETPGVTDTEIIIGSSSALTGHASFLGKNYLHGAMLRINEINEQGGINGRRIKVIAYDDEYDPAKAIVNTQKLINEDKVFALFNYVGTPTAVKIIPIVEEAQVPLVGLFTGAHILREPVKKYIFNVRASYYEETELAIEHFVDYKTMEKIAVFHQADDYGIDGYEGVMIALEKRGLNPVAVSSYVRGTMDVEEGVKIISESGAEAVVMVGTYSPIAKFVKLIKKINPRIMLQSVSFIGPEAFLEEAGEYGEGVLITQVVPPPEEIDLLEWADAYRNNLAKYYPGEIPTFGGLEGFINARVLIEGLRREGKEITREGFIKTMESIKDYSIGMGASITFSENDHQGLDKIYCTVIENGKFIIHDYKK